MNIHDIVEKHDKKIVYSLVILAMLYGVLAYKPELITLDELDWTIRFERAGSFINMIKGLLNYGYNMPAYYVLLYPVCLVAGENVRLMVFLSTFMTGVGIIGCYFGARAIMRKSNALIVAIFAVGAGVLTNEAMWKIRPYGLLFMLTSLILWIYLERLVNGDTAKNIIVYTVLLCAIMMTHWFGSLVCVMYGVFDLVRIYKKETKLFALVPYVIAGMVFVPWLLLMMNYHTNDLTDYFAQIPGLTSLVSVISFLFSKNKIMVLVVLMAVLFAVGYIVIMRAWDKIKAPALLLSCIVWVYITIFVYSRYINPDGSLFVHRYFMVFLPHILILMGWTVEILCDRKRAVPVVIAILAIVTIFQSYIYSYSKYVESDHGYYRAAEYIKNHIAKQGDNILVLSSKGGFYTDFYNIGDDISVANGINHVKLYSFENGDKIEKELTEDELAGYDEIYAFTLHGNDFSDEVIGMLEDTGEADVVEEGFLTVYRSR